MLIASDIHGSENYCGKMLEAFRRERAERILSKDSQKAPSFSYGDE